MLSKENNESSSKPSYTDTSSSDEEWKRQTKDKKKFVVEDSDETPTPTKPKRNINMKQKTLKKPVTQKKSKSQTVLKKSKQYKNIINEPYMSSVKNNISNTSFTSSLRKSNKKTVKNSSTTIETIQEQASEDVNVFSDALNVEFSEMSTDTTSLKKTLTFLYVAMKKLTIEINLMKNDFQALCNGIERLMLVKNNQISTPAFVEKYNFVKIQFTEEFKTFDSELQTNNEFAKDFVSICFAIAL
ncbi:uncharacterized protein LOC112458105 isoform X1 [Temnothorax curvispinosus]|uniref:Uncharacterized protein LOC112458105 isoform X1 n=1 Tax=Temnothorax curvispinosus TaxID=300111 RepID=A0A6J1Q6K8_9HYME|nr:uncharacterized protein LOC112458105 isoform X1 [Temnothorax curvispinosus]